MGGECVDAVLWVQRGAYPPLVRLGGGRAMAGAWGAGVGYGDVFPRNQTDGGCTETRRETGPSPALTACACCDFRSCMSSPYLVKAVALWREGVVREMELRVEWETH